MAEEKEVVLMKGNEAIAHAARERAGQYLHGLWRCRSW